MNKIRCKECNAFATEVDYCDDYMEGEHIQHCYEGVECTACGYSTVHLV